MRVPSRRLGRVLTLVLIPTTLVITGALVTTLSYSAFSASTVDSGNSWAAGQVTLADDDSGTAMFAASGLKPGDTGSRCIAVTSSGTVPSVVKLYGTGHATTRALSDYLTIDVTQGTGGSFAGGCAGFSPAPSNAVVYSGTLAAFAASATDYGHGLPGSAAWAPSGSSSETRVFRFAYTLSSSTPNTAEGGTSTIGFTWEAQSS